MSDCLEFTFTLNDWVFVGTVSSNVVFFSALCFNDFLFFSYHFIYRKSMTLFIWTLNTRAFHLNMAKIRRKYCNFIYRLRQHRNSNANCLLKSSFGSVCDLKQRKSAINSIFTQLFAVLGKYTFRDSSRAKKNWSIFFIKFRQTDFRFGRLSFAGGCFRLV